MPQTTPFKFSTIINQALLQYTVAFQAGQTIPPTPDEFEENLTEQLNAWNKNWPDSIDEQNKDLLANALTAYASVYAAILSLPLPSNPAEDYQAWYDSTHP